MRSLSLYSLLKRHSLGSTGCGMALFLIVAFILTSPARADVITQVFAGMGQGGPWKCIESDSGTPLQGASSSCLVTDNLPDELTDAIIGTGTVSESTNGSMDRLTSYIAATASVSVPDGTYSLGVAEGTTYVFYDEPAVRTTSSEVRYIDLMASFHATSNVSQYSYANFGGRIETNDPTKSCDVAYDNTGLADVTLYCKLLDVPFSIDNPFQFKITLAALVDARVVGATGTRLAVATLDATHTALFQLQALDANFQPVPDAVLTGSDGVIYPNIISTPEPRVWRLSAVFLAGMILAHRRRIT